mgnify:CR=1 FL=1
MSCKRRSTNQTARALYCVKMQRLSEFTLQSPGSRRYGEQKVKETTSLEETGRRWVDKKRSSLTGNWTRVSSVTGRNTSHYTIRDYWGKCQILVYKLVYIKIYFYDILWISSVSTEKNFLWWIDRLILCFNKIADITEAVNAKRKLVKYCHDSSSCHLRYCITAHRRQCS